MTKYRIKHHKDDCPEENHPFDRFGWAIVKECIISLEALQEGGEKFDYPVCATMCLHGPHAQPPQWEKEFDERYVKLVANAYPDYRESHNVILADIKSFIRTLLEKTRGEAESKYSCYKAHQAGEEDGRQALLEKIKKEMKEIR